MRGEAAEEVVVGVDNQEFGQRSAGAGQGGAAFQAAGDIAQSGSAVRAASP